MTDFGPLIANPKSFLLGAAAQLLSLIHILIGAGSFIMQRAVVNTHTVIEHGVLVNSGAVVDHDSYVARGAHIGLGSVVKANCRIDEKRKVEAGEVVFSTRRKIDGVTSRDCLLYTSRCV